MMLKPNITRFVPEQVPLFVKMLFRTLAAPDICELPLLPLMVRLFSVGVPKMIIPGVLLVMVVLLRFHVPLLYIPPLDVPTLPSMVRPVTVSVPPDWL